ncbi:Tol-Pal system protein TolB [Campylobacter sp. CCUG 57310]|uniref:Tol-Pal system protein TolB n=1 Tax=Campylobacter sp. CCUG 57310 TaxID=2517362 RepID=UPI0015663E64|nr:Tol-Pal system protein TolB [Campylobacter sp. CCUG 57310]QKF92805.1 Tol-Pal system translocation protein TolB [Campylobacter sp. CCUG 57310]
MKKIVLLLSLAIGLFAVDATIAIVNKGLALPKIVLQDATTMVSDQAFKSRFHKIMLGDLKVSSDFEVVDEYIQSSYEGDSNTNVMSEKSAQLIFRYALEGSPSTPLRLKVKLINAKTATTQYERAYTMDDGAKFPFLAHKAIVELVNELKMPPVNWMEKFIVFAKGTGSKQSEIVVADYTLTYQKVIVRGGLNIFPKWSGADQSAFYYSDYSGAKLVLYKFELATGKKTKILETSGGMLVASDVSESGDKLLLTMAPQDQPDIYIYDLNSKKLKQITNYSGIDVNGNFVDHDSKVVFVSDRLGYPNIFSQSVNGGAVEQMVYHGKNNNSVSAYQNYVVYSSREDAKSEFGTRDFNIYLISTKTEYIRQLTASGKNLYPRFSSDGQSVVFIKELGGQSSLGIIRVNENKSFQFPLKIGKIQSIDW